MNDDNEKKTKKKVKRRTFTDQSRYYIDKDEYTDELMQYKNSGVCSERLGELYKIHVDRYASAANFKGYTYLDEMKGQALLFLMKYSHNHFNGKNAFSYCTAIIYHAFIQVIAKEKKHSELKDKLIKSQERIDPDRSRFSVLDHMILDEEDEENNEKPKEE